MNDTVNTFRIKTDKIQLRFLNEGDLEALFRLRVNESVNEYQDRPKHNNIEETRLFIEETRSLMSRNEMFFWVICQLNSNELIGTMSVFNINRDNNSAEIQYELLPDYQGKGYMQDALVETIQYCISTIGLNTLHAEVDPANLKSVKLLERNGFMLDESLKDHEFFGGQLKDSVTYYFRRS